MLKKFGRYVMVEGPEGWVFKVEQRGAAMVNVTFGLGFIVVGALWKPTEASILPNLFLIIGAIWTVISAIALLDKRKFIFSSKGVSCSSAFSREQCWPKDEIQTIRVYKQDYNEEYLHDNSSKKKRRRRPIFPWRIELINKRGEVFNGDFKLNTEQDAKDIALILSDILGVEVTEELDQKTSGTI